MANGSEEGIQATPGSAELIPVPSGQAVSLQEVIWNEPGPMGLTLRFRFVAPAIAAGTGTVDSETASADMAALCQSFALPRISDFGPQPAQVIISMSDQPVPFGESAPEITQFFEAFRIEDGACVWEMF